MPDPSLPSASSSAGWSPSTSAPTTTTPAFSSRKSLGALNTTAQMQAASANLAPSGPDAGRSFTTTPSPLLSYSSAMQHPSSYREGLRTALPSHQRRAPSPLFPRHSHSASTSSSGGLPQPYSTTSESYSSSYTSSHYTQRHPSPGHHNRVPGSGVPPVSRSSPSASRPRTADATLGNSPSRLTRKNTGSSSSGILSSGGGAAHHVDVKRLMSKPAVTPHQYPGLQLPPSEAAARPTGQLATPGEDNPPGDAFSGATAEPLRVGRSRSRTMDAMLLESSHKPPAFSPVSVEPLPSLPARNPNRLRSAIEDAAGKPTAHATEPTRSKSYNLGSQLPSSLLQAPSSSIATRQSVSETELGRSSSLSTTGASQHKFGITPASAMVLAWNESQQRNNAPIASSVARSEQGHGREPLTPISSTSPATERRARRLSLPFNDLLEHTIPLPHHRSLSRSTPTPTQLEDTRALIVMTPASDDTQTQAMVDDGYHPKASTSGSGGGMMKELTRRVTGRLSKSGGSSKAKKSENPSPVFQKAELDTQHLVIPQPRGSSLTASSYNESSFNASSVSPSRKSWRTASDSGHPPPPVPTGSDILSALDYHNQFVAPPLPQSQPLQVTPTPLYTSTSSSHRSKSPGPAKSMAMAQSDDAEGQHPTAPSRLWKLVRKLSSGGLRRDGLEGGLEGSECAPPVPPLPKDFELIDHEAYLAADRERNREKERIWTPKPQLRNLEALGPDSSSTHSTPALPHLPTTPTHRKDTLPTPITPSVLLSPPNSASSKLSHRDRVSSSASAALESPAGLGPRRSSRAKSSTQSSSNSISNHSPTVPLPASPAASFLPNPPVIIAQHQHVQSLSHHLSVTRPSTDNNELNTSLRSSSPTFSSSVLSELSSSRLFVSPYAHSRRSSLSSYGELAAAHPTNTHLPTANAGGRPIMPSDERLRQEESGKRSGREREPSARSQPRGPRRVSNAAASAEARSVTLPSTTSSSRVDSPSAPRRNTISSNHVEKEKGLSAIFPKSRPNKSPIRPKSSPPGSPLMPEFTNAEAANNFPSHRRSASLHRVKTGTWTDAVYAAAAAEPMSPRPSFAGPLTLSPPPIPKRFAAQRSTIHALPRSVSVPEVVSPVVAAPPQQQPAAPVIYPVSDDDDGDELDSKDDSPSKVHVMKAQKLKLNTSSGLLAKVRAVRGPRSSGVGDRKDFEISPLQSGKSTLSRMSVSRKRTPSDAGPSSGSTGPYSSLLPTLSTTAFAFKELKSEASPLTALSEQEREDKWEALLLRSEQAGGTLVARMDPLLSDTMSVAGDD